MTVKYLWEVLDSAGKTWTLLDYSTLRGFNDGHRKWPMLLLGVDISILITAIRKAYPAGSETNHLRTFFYKLCEFSKAPVVPIFVFDGPLRPPMKRGKTTCVRNDPITPKLKILIDAFGFYSHDAPGEAEAELAFLSKLGFIDLVLSQDGDALVFGALCVFRMPNGDVESSSRAYDAHSILSSPTNLSYDGLLLIAVLCGGDYHDGLAGIGGKTASALARQGFGESLAAILRLCRGEALEKQLRAWNAALRNELRSNASGTLAQTYAQVANSIPVDFPDALIVRRYLEPVTSWSPGQSGPPTIPWIPRPPNVREISRLALDELKWSIHERDSKFTNLLWPACTFNLLSSPLVSYNPAKRYIATPFLHATILKVSQSTKKHSSYSALLRVRLSTEGFRMQAGLPSLATNAKAPELVTVPESVLAVAVRDQGAPTRSLFLSAAFKREFKLSTSTSDSARAATRSNGGLAMARAESDSDENEDGGQDSDEDEDDAQAEVVVVFDTPKKAKSGGGGKKPEIIDLTHLPRKNSSVRGRQHRINGPKVIDLTEASD